MAIYADIQIDQGSNFSSIVVVDNQNGNSLDLTGYTARGKIRKSYESLNYIVFSAEITSAVDGRITISLTSTQTALLKAGRYVYDVEIIETANSKVTRVIEGQVNVTPSVTTTSVRPNNSNGGVFVAVLEAGSVFTPPHGAEAAGTSYKAFDLVVLSSGLYSLTAKNIALNGDVGKTSPAIYLYDPDETFDKDSPLDNLLAYDEGIIDNSEGDSSSFNYNLLAGKTYTCVATSYHTGITGEFSIDVEKI